MALSERRRHSASADKDITKRYEQGIRLQAQDRHAEAASRFRKVLAARPDHAQALLGLVQSLIAIGQSGEATSLLDAAAADLATSTDVARLKDIATACLLVEHAPRAEELYRHLLSFTPDDSDALMALGSLLHKRGEAQQAVDLLSRAIEAAPLSASPYMTLGVILYHEAMFDDAEACFRRAIELDPENPAIYTNYTAMLEIMGRIEEAIELSSIALRFKPDCDATRWNLARFLLSSGHIEAGWDMYGFGFACGQRKPLRPFPGLIWEGEDLKDKTIMVWREQGLGDDLYFSSCYTDLIAQAGHVIIETAPRLVPLYQRTWPQATIRAETGTSTGQDNYGPVDFDVTAPAGMIAARLRRSLDAFPAEPTRLIPAPDRFAAAREWLASLGPGTKIGIAWGSSVNTKIRSLMYMPLREWQPLFALPGVQIVNLQYTDIREEAEAFSHETGFTLHQMPGLDLREDIEGAAALSAALDLVVAPANFSLLLAAAVGTPGHAWFPARDWPRLGTRHLPWFPHITCHDFGYGLTPAPLVKKLVGDISATLSPVA